MSTRLQGQLTDFKLSLCRERVKRLPLPEPEKNLIKRQQVYTQ